MTLEEINKELERMKGFLFNSRYKIQLRKLKENLENNTNTSS